MFVGDEDELGIGYRRSNLGQTKYRVTKGSGLNVNGSTMKLIRWKRRGSSRIVTRSHMMVIGQRVSDHVFCFPNRRVSLLRVFNAIRIDSGSSVK